MGILFISHSSRDNEQAIKVRNWLKEHGWGEVFLDLDPEQGLAPGHRWQQELKQAGERCSGVVLLISPDWLASRWCQTEFLLADQLGKKIFPIFIRPTLFDELPIELKAKFQIIDISDPAREKEGFERFAIGLKRAGLDPRSFEWPPPGAPHRPIYRGLQALEIDDAAVFFGRDAQITDGLDTLRRMRDGSIKRMLVIQGASGAGKSSFLRAGLIARLKRDEENFLVLPIIRPERALMSGEHGLAASLASGFAAHKTSRDIQTVFDELRAKVTERLARYSERAHETRDARPPTIVIPIDQAEELFAAENTEAPHALDLLVSAVLADANAVIVATIRSDAFGKMQEAPTLANVPTLPFSLAAMPHAAFKDVIEGPARLAIPPLSVEPALTEQLLRDLATDDALPLLAFTLERLLYRRRGKQTLALADYAHEMGGLQGAILAAVEEAFNKAQRDPSLPKDRLQLERLARAAFIPGLVQVDSAESEPKRRVERLDALPGGTHALIRHFVDARLLVSDRRMIDGRESETIEVVHEAILRQWPALRSWIAEERDALRALDGVRAAARDWQARQSTADQGKAWLVHGGGRLEEAEQLLAPLHFANALQSFEKNYLIACRARDNEQHMREVKGIARTRRLQRNIGVLMAIASVVILIAGIGIAGLLKGIATRSSDALARLSEQASDNQNYESAARYALAALAGADRPILGYPSARAERALRSAEALSPTVAVLLGHKGYVSTAAYSPDGTRIVTASADNTVRIWDARTGKQIAVVRGHGGPVNSAAYSGDGARIVTTSDDKTARIWDARTGKQIAVLGGHEGAVYSGAYSPDGTRIVTSSADRTARVWDARTGKQIAILHGHESVVYTVAYDPGGTRIVTASDDKTARVWDARTGTQIAVLRGHDGAVVTAVYSPDSAQVVTASDDKTARIWDARTGTQIAVLRGHDGPLSSAAYSPNGTHIVTASFDKTVCIWDARTGTQLAVLRGHDGIVNSALYNPNGTRIATASNDRTARVWDARTGMQIAVLLGHNGYIYGAAFNPDGTRVVTASVDQTARIWDARTGKQIAALRGHKGYVWSAAYSLDGMRIVTASDDKTARIWDARTNSQIAVLRGHNDIVFNAVYSRDGARIATASYDKTARIWDARMGTQIAVLRGHDDAIASVAFSPDGTRMVTASVDKTARIWDARTGKQISVLRGHDGYIYDAVYSHDGSRIVTGSADKTARIWDARTGKQISVLRGHDGAVKSIAYSPDGTRIVTGSADRTVRIWDAHTGTQLAVLRGHDDTVNSVAYSSDGAQIVTTSSDKTARIWQSPHVDASLLSLSRKALIDHACAILLKDGGLDHLSTEELAAAPDLDPELDANACHPPSLWARVEQLIFESSK